ncbi:MAG: CehA/McbA family metallohydrolase, partial [Anaerolineae bacterium]
GGSGEAGKGAGGSGEAGKGARRSGSPGWYRGDLHTHTVHSDAEGLSVADLLAMARRAGLDFVFLTDHNTTAGHAEMEAAAGDGFLPAVGLELTTFWGHAVCLGTRDWVDWRIRPGTGEMARTADAIYAAGQVFIIAHPQSPGDPCCTGCAWRFGDMMPGNARLVEIWNGPWAGDSGNEASLALWYDWLNQGYRLIATAGSDTHAATDYDRRPGFNAVYADALTEAALLKALLAGHLYLSAGPQVTLEARDEAGATRMMGDTAVGPAEFILTWAACPPDARVRVIVDGKLLVERPAAPGAGMHAWRMAPADGHWVLVEIRSREGQMLAITNPIFVTSS